MFCLQLGKAVTNLFYKLSLNSIIRQIASDAECITASTNASTNASTKGNNFLPCSLPFQKRPCKYRKEPVRVHTQYSFTSMWPKPRCCIYCQLSKNELRHDVKFLKEIDWTERTFQRTWYQCPERRLRRRVCRPIDLPPIQVRKRGAGNPDAKWIGTVRECANLKRSCIKTVVKYPCQKRCTLYPSFSECCRFKCSKQKENECGCQYIGGLCAINEYERRMKKLSTTFLNIDA